MLNIVSEKDSRCRRNLIRAFLKLYCLYLYNCFYSLGFRETRPSMLRRFLFIFHLEEILQDPNCLYLTDLTVIEILRQARRKESRYSQRRNRKGLTSLRV